MPEFDYIRLEKYFDGVLDESAREQLAERLKSDSAFRATYLEEVRLRGLLKEAFGHESKAARFRAPIRRTLMVWGAAATITLVSIFAFFRYGDPPAVESVSVEPAQITSRGGHVIDLRSGAPAGAALEPGGRFALRGRASSLAWRYSDGSSLLVLGPGEFSLGNGPNKSIELHSGVIHADVAKQPVGLPMEIQTAHSAFKVLGTRLAVDSQPKRTDLIVAEGLVEMTDLRSGEAIKVAAGNRAQSGENGTLRKAKSTTNDVFFRDFEDGIDSNLWGEFVTDDLPLGSEVGLAAKPRVRKQNQRTYHQIGFRERGAGLCQVVDGMCFELTFKTSHPRWFNVFIRTVKRDEYGGLSISQYKLDPKLIAEPAATRGQWHRVVVPLHYFRGSGEQGFDGPSPASGELVTLLFMSSPEPSRNLVIDEVAIRPSEQDHISIESIESRSE